MVQSPVGASVFIVIEGEVNKLSAETKNFVNRFPKIIFEKKKNEKSQDNKQN